MNECKVWKKEIENLSVKIAMLPMVIVLTIILIVIAGIIFITSRIIEKIESKNKNKRP